MSTPLMIAFDVEPNGLDIPRHERVPWTGFERAAEIASEVRQRLQDSLKRQVRFTWFLRMDPQIEQVYGSPLWAAETYAPQLERLRAAGDELGLHPHAHRWDDAQSCWRTDVANGSWVEECMRSSFDAYEQAFGQACRTHRFGDRYFDNGIVAVLRDLGVTTDLTLEPGRGAVRTPMLSAEVPDQTHVPRRHYQPEPSDFRRPRQDVDPDGLWLLPLAAADPDPALPAWRRLGRRVRHRGQPRHRPVLLWAPWPSRLLWDIVARDVERGALTTLPFAIRVDTLLRPEWARAFEGHMAALADHPLAHSIELTTPSGAIAALADPTGR